MNWFANIWNHPKTSICGLLIGITTVAGVLGQQGITLGAAGTGTVVSLISGIDTALLGLLARDPESTSSTGSTQKLGVWMLLALLLPLPFIEGCTEKSVAQQIVNWTPALESAVATIDSAATVLLPADAAIFAAATVGFDAAANLLEDQAKAYLANPSASVLAQLQTAITTFEQDVNSALLAAAKITNSNSQKSVLSAVNAAATIASAILVLIEAVSTKAQIARMAAATPVKLAAVEHLRNNDEAARLVAAHYKLSLSRAQNEVSKNKMKMMAAGF